jgi:hypothetical protein
MGRDSAGRVKLFTMGQSSVKQKEELSLDEGCTLIQ